MLGTFFCIAVAIFLGQLIYHRATKRKSNILRVAHKEEPQIRSANEIYFAWTSGDLQRMLKVIHLETNAIDRHFLLSSIVQQTYILRKNKEMNNICKDIAEQHMRELPNLLPIITKEIGVNGTPPHIPTLQYLSTILTEENNFAGAIDICQKGIDLGLHDNTVSGFAGRISRIRKKVQPAEAP